MDLKRTIIRRIIWILTGVVVYAALSFVGIGNAHAGTLGCPIGGGCDQGEAYALCEAHGAEMSAEKGYPSGNLLGHICMVSSGDRYQCRVLAVSGPLSISCKIRGDESTSHNLYFFGACPVGTVWNEVAKRCGTNCATLAPETNVNLNMSLYPDGFACKDGCQVVMQTPPGEKCFVTDSGCWSNGSLVANGQQCALDDPNEEDAPETCEAGEKLLMDGSCQKQGDCPVGQHQGPVSGVINGKTVYECVTDGSCPVGQVKGPDGSCVDQACPAGQVKGGDGTCKKDEDGDGEPDEGEEEGTFSGGDSCDAPPQCSGDNIMCGQARIQWRIDCNTRKNRTVTGGHCGNGGAPICTGEKCDQLEQAQMLFAWRAACALEEGSGSAGDGSGQPEWTKVGGMTQNPGEGAGEGDTNVFGEEVVVDGSNLDSSGFVGGGGSCPALSSGGGGQLSQAFMSSLASPPTAWCGFVGWGYVIIVLVNTLGAIFYLART